MDEMHSGVRRMPVLGAILVLLLVLAGASLYYALQNQAAGGAVGKQTAVLARAAAAMPGAAYAARGGEADAFDKENLSRLGPKDEVKFVLADRQDYDYALEICARYDLYNLVAQVLFSPAFDELDPRHLAQWMVKDRCRGRFNIQLHKVIWDPHTPKV